MCDKMRDNSFLQINNILTCVVSRQFLRFANVLQWQVQCLTVFSFVSIFFQWNIVIAFWLCCWLEWVSATWNILTATVAPELRLK